METLYKYGWYALIAAAVGDLPVSFALSLFYKGYSCMTMSISALGNPSSPVRTPFNIWMIAEGMLFLVSIPALYKYYHAVSGGAAILTVAFVAVFAVGACIFTGFFSVNESKDIVTTASKIHGVGSVIGFMLFLFVPLLTAVLSFKNKESGLGAVSVVCFIASLVFFTLFVMSDKPEFSQTFICKEGLWQRLTLLFMYLPVVMAAVKRLQEA